MLEQYGDFSSGFTKEYATKNRDMVLEALSDSGTVAPLIMTANLHSRAYPKSYMYVFSHPKAMQDYSGVSRSRRYNEDRLSRLRRPSTKREPDMEREKCCTLRQWAKKGCEEEEGEGGGERGAVCGEDDELKCTSFNAPIRAVSCNVVIPRCACVAPENGGHFSSPYFIGESAMGNLLFLIL